MGRRVVSLWVLYPISLTNDKIDSYGMMQKVPNW